MSNSKKPSDRQSFTLQFGEKSDEDQPVEPYVVPPDEEEEEQPPGDEFVFFNPVFALRGLRSRPSTATVPKRASKKKAPPDVPEEPSQAAVPPRETVEEPTILSGDEPPPVVAESASNPDNILDPNWDPDEPSISKPLPQIKVPDRPVENVEALPDKKINEFGFVLPPEYKKRKGPGGAAYAVLAAGVLLAVGGIGGAWFTLNGDNEQIAEGNATPTDQAVTAEPETKTTDAAPTENVEVATAQTARPSPSSLTAPTLDNSQISIPTRPSQVAAQEQLAISAPAQTIAPDPSGRASAPQMESEAPGGIARSQTAALTDTIGLPSQRTATSLAKPSLSDMPDVMTFAAQASELSGAQSGGGQQIAAPADPNLPNQLPSLALAKPSFRFSDTPQVSERGPSTASLDGMTLRAPWTEQTDEQTFELSLADDALSGISRAQDNSDLGLLKNFDVVNSDLAGTAPTTPVVENQADNGWSPPSTFELASPELPSFGVTSDKRSSQAPTLVIAAAQIPFQNQSGFGDNIQYGVSDLAAPTAPPQPSLDDIPDGIDLATFALQPAPVMDGSSQALAKSAETPSALPVDERLQSQGTPPTLIAMSAIQNPRFEDLDAAFTDQEPWNVSMQPDPLGTPNRPDMVPELWLSIDRLGVWQAPMQPPVQQDFAFAAPIASLSFAPTPFSNLVAPEGADAVAVVSKSVQGRQPVQINVLRTGDLLAPSEPPFDVALIGRIATPSSTPELAAHSGTDSAPDVSGLKRYPAEAQIAAFQPAGIRDGSEIISGGVQLLKDTGPNRVERNSQPEGQANDQLALSRFNSAPVTRNQVAITGQPSVPSQTAAARPPEASTTIVARAQNLAKPPAPAVSADTATPSTDAAPRAIAFISVAPSETNTAPETPKQTGALEKLAPLVARAAWSIDFIETLADTDNSVRIEKTTSDAEGWAAEGAIIRAVNGAPVQSVSDLDALISTAAADAAKGKIAVDLQIEAAQGGVENHSVKLPVQRVVELTDGTQLSIQQSRKKWKTTVVAASAFNAGLQAGDVLLFDFITKEKLTTPTAIDKMLTSLSDQQITEVTVAIVRDGGIENAVFLLPAAN